MNQARSYTMSHVEADTSEPLLETTLGGLMRRIAAEVPDRVALVEGIADASKRRRWTYARLVAESERIARPARPVQTRRLGGAARPRHARMGHHPAGGFLRRPRARADQPRLCGARGRIRAEKLGGGGHYHAEASRAKNLRAFVDEVRPRLPLLRSDVDALVKAADPARPLPRMKPDDIVQIHCISGTTGFPKGAWLHHRGVINTSRNIALRARFPDGGVWPNAMPMFHIGGDVGCEIGTFAMRGTFVLMQGFDPGLMLELIEAERGNISLILPTMILALLDHSDRAKRDCSSLKTILSGAASVPAALVLRAQEAFGYEFCMMRPDGEPVHGDVDRTQPRGPDADRRQGRAANRGQDRRSGVARRYAGRPGRRNLGARLQDDVRLLRPAGGNGGGADAGWLAAHRRLWHRGFARLLPHHGPPEGHDHPRRHEPLPAGDRARPVRACRRRADRCGGAAGRPIGRNCRRDRAAEECSMRSPRPAISRRSCSRTG